MVVTCCIPRCKNTVRNKEISFHKFPIGDQQMRRMWINIINSDTDRRVYYPVWEPTKHDRICGAHFNSSGIRTTEKYPTLFPYRRTVLKGSIIKQKLRPADIYTVPDYDNEVTIGFTGETLTSSSNTDYWSLKELLMTSACDTSLRKQENCPDKSDHPYAYHWNLDDAAENNRLREIIEHLTEKIETANKTVHNLRQALKQSKQQNNIARRQLTNLRKSSHNQLLQSEKLQKTLKLTTMSEHQLHFYTGFKTRTLLTNFLNLMRPAYEIAKQILTCKSKRNSMDFETECLIVLMKLRLGLLEEDLAYRFGISQATISRVWNFWLDLLAAQLTQIPIWPSKTIVQKYLPEDFRLHFPHTRVILDCTEMFIEKASDADMQSCTYSLYKHHNTVKGLVGITPNGFVSFVSPLYPGRTSDNQIVQDCGLLNLLEEGDSVMTDRGFLIADILAAKKVDLHCPPFLLDKQQFTFEEMQKTKSIASVRVHVERVNAIIKNFRILKCILPITMQTQLNNIWLICCYLVNFIGEPLRDRQHSSK